MNPKAQSYVEHMAEAGSETWEYALWSSLALELLTRSALSNVSPALLADTGEKKWSHLYHSLGFTPNEPKFSPRSISMQDVIRRLQDIFIDFDKELGDFCIAHIGKRNAELHSGERPFEGVNSSHWLPQFYRACKVLLGTMGFELKEFFGDEQADLAGKLIVAAADKAAQAVHGDIHAFQEAWNKKGEDERSSLIASATAWATRQTGHRVNCPACQSQSLVTGEPVSAPQRVLQEDDQIVETQDYLPNRFECIACGLKISGLSRLNFAGLGDLYKKTQIYDAAIYYTPEDPFSGFEDDNNEPY